MRNRILSTNRPLHQELSLHAGLSAQAPRPPTGWTWGPAAKDGQQGQEENTCLSRIPSLPQTCLPTAQCPSEGVLTVNQRLQQDRFYLGWGVAGDG